MHNLKSHLIWDGWVTDKTCNKQMTFSESNLTFSMTLTQCLSNAYWPFQPAVYVAESAISSGTAGSSSDGAQNTAAIAAGLALISIAAASSILLQVGKKPPQVQTPEYSGPSLSYYINKFVPPEITQAPAPTETELSSPVQLESSETEASLSVQPETSSEQVSQVQVESQIQAEASSVDIVS